MRVWNLRSFCAFGAMMLSLSACKAGGENGAAQNPSASVSAAQAEAHMTASYPLRKQFACLPREAALVAAHRGVSKGEGFAENSEGSLKSLIEKGIMVAEVDVAGLKDGVHILFHDGVWDEKSTGTGVVPASTWADAEKILLKDTDGNLTADRPVKLEDFLAIAKDRIYLEVDFKSSAKYETVIDAIRSAGMADRVILIAYNDAQASRMAELAPEMLLSVTINSEEEIERLEQQGVSRKNMTAWSGRGPYDATFMAKLDDMKIPVLAWPRRDDLESTAAPASLVVSDYAFSLDPIMGLGESAQKTYEACLAK